MRVVHLFDRYLNNTMSWAYRLIKNTPDVKSSVAAPLILRNKYFDPEFNFVEDPFRRFLHIPNERNEWEISYFSNVWAAIALRTFFPVYVKFVIFREKIDLMHAHFAHVGVEYMRIASRYNIPLIVSFYGTDYERLPFEQPKYVNLYGELFKSARILICEGKNGADLLQKMGCPFHKIRIVKLGIDSSSITNFTKKKRKDSLLLIQAATFTETKGFVFTIRAFAEALKYCPDMTLTLVGEKWEKNYWNEVAELIMQLGLQDKIKVLEFIEDDFHLFLSKFDVFIHPSCYSKVMECEGGAPVVLLDAQMVGLPVISTFHCDIPEEVIDGVTGLLSNEKDIISLRDNISRFYRMDDSEYQTFSKNARKHVTENYDSRKNSIALKSVYEEVLS